MEVEIKGLVRQRTSYKAQITRLYNALVASEELSLDKLQQREQKLEQYYTSVSDLQLKIESLEDNAENEIVREGIETIYYQCSDYIKDYKNKLERSAGSKNMTSVTPPPSIVNVPSIVPKIQIKPFDGSYAEWNSFHDTFRDLVHDNVSLPIVHKFHLLKSYLRGDASTVIEALNASEENYYIAWNLLQKRFDNPRKIIQAHIKALFEIPNVDRKCPASLRSLADRVEMHLNALKSLKQPVDWHEMLIYIVTAKLDENTRIHWERSIADDNPPTINELLSFISKFAMDIEPLNLGINKPPIEAKRHAKGRDTTRQVFISAKDSVNCPICKGKHFIQACDQFLKLDTRSRLQEVKKAKLCVNCFRSGHKIFQCKYGNCRQCNKKHNTLLHFEEISTEQAVASKDDEPTSSNAVTLLSYENSEILLSTARVIICDQTNRERQCRVLLDPGSQSNFITENLAKTLNLKRHSINMPVSGLGENNNCIKQYTTTTIKSRLTNFAERITLLVIPTITGRLPSRQVDRTKVSIPSNIQLADPEFYKPAPVDALLGEYLFYKLLSIGQIRLPNSKSVLQKTRLGWIVSGEISCDSTVKNKTRCHLAKQELEAQITKFWELEECSVQRHLSAEEKQCEYHYQRHTQRDNLGRYIVRFPFKEGAGKFGDSYKGALKRFYSLERKLEGQDELHKQYSEFMAEYLKLGHMSIIEKDTIHEGLYLPHHAVIKTTSTTTKLRVVFDASAKTSSGVSLNDTLLVGPTIQDDIFQLISRFRLHNYVLTADIEKMFRQIKMHPEDTVFQKILWRDSCNEPIKVFRLNTVTYGTASAPFLAVRTLKQLAIDEGHAFPLAAEALERDFYMDDLLTGANTISQAIELREQLIKLLKLGGFNLRQWSSNEPMLVQESSDHIALDKVHFIASDTKKTLGIGWNAKQDYIYYSVDTNTETKRVTKRSILSQIAKLYDPLGLLGPIVISAKLIMQDLWKAQLEWDEAVPQHIYTAWINYISQLPALNNFQIPRKVLTDSPSDLQLHGFADASEKGYGACLYIRCANINHKIVSNLICAKSRVAPLKSTSLPRLELCAAVLLVRLYVTTVDTLKLTFSKIKFWSDSTITLNWIRTSPHILKTFVANRVAEIQSHTQTSDWAHVSSSQNPADYISRGQPPREFMENQIWLHGPEWLNQEEYTWPKTILPYIEIPEQRTKVALIATTTLDKTDIFYRFSSFSKLQRTIAYCIRFKNLASKRDDSRGELSISELKRAHDIIIIRAQAQIFARELLQLKQNKFVDKDSKLLSLNPFVDSNGIIRVGGRLKNATIAYTQMHPILLPKSHPVTSLIILYEHLQALHAGIQATINAVRRRYWPIDGKNTTRFIIRKCIRCVRAKPPSPPDYLMGDLPRARLHASRPFENVGIDYCGPLYIKERRFRNQKRLKVYTAVFVCFLTKALHLELVSDLTTEAFLAALKRFISRRGRPKHIYTDNGTNFIGAKNELAQLFELMRSKEHDNQVTRYLAEREIAWHLSPPNSPHFGGLWEAGVKSFKHHFIRTVGDTLLTYEQLNTYVIEIEGILNSRPLSPLSSDPNDLQVLTPGHFLIGESLTSLPETNLAELPSNRLSLWQHTQKIKQHFWARWYKEYINELNIRSKWQKNTSKKIERDDLVLIKEEALPSMRWPLGRVLEIHPGKDGIVRVATIKTANGIYKRCVKKLCVLPTDTAVNCNN
ncbi:hypothetical protein ANTPLA_LOCUS1910 [Anthophora plagiata]